MMQRFNIGCSSFDNSYWTGVFYPNDLDRNRRFEFYCQYFSTFEINSTFYKFPSVRALRTWNEKAPADFTFSIKAPQEITHKRQFVNCDDEIQKFYDVCASGMGGKLARILFQFPPSFKYSAESLQNIVRKLNPDFQNVIEFRHQSWWNSEVYDRLNEHQITFCSVSYPNIPDQIIASKTPYMRLHGDEKLFYSGYSSEYLQTLFGKLKHSSADEIYIYFNNTASIAGILNALEMNLKTGY